jgi:hypothetical protein
MKKTLILAVLLTVILTPGVRADMKYSEQRTTEMSMPDMGGMMGMPGMEDMEDMEDMPPQFKNMMQNMMQKMFRSTSNKITTYVKDTKKRVDDHKDNVSTITRCQERQIIKLNHKKKTYKVLDMEQKAKEIEQICSEMKNTEHSEVSTEIPDTPYDNPNQAYPGQLVMKQKLIDTQEEEMIGNLKARHYIKHFEIYGNPNCIPNMKNTEHLWTTNFNPEEIQCPIIQTYKNCMFPVMKTKPDQRMDCFKNVKHIREGLAEVPGFVVKRVTEINPSQMGGGMGMPPGQQMPPMMGASGTMTTTETIVISDISREPLPDSLFEPPQEYKELPANPRDYEDIDL